MRGPKTLGKTDSLVTSGDAVWAVSKLDLVRERAGEVLELVDVNASLRHDHTTELLAVGDAVLAWTNNECGGFDLHAVTHHARIEVCGRRAQQPELVSTPEGVVVYAVFEPGSTASSTVELPTVDSRGLTELGPVCYPAHRTGDPLLRVIMRCSVELDECSTQTFVSPRSSLDAVWVDPKAVPRVRPGATSSCADPSTAPETGAFMSWTESRPS